MGFTVSSCDDCRKELSRDDDYYVDYDNVVRCKPCHLKEELRQARDELKELVDWLNNTHLRRVAEIEEKIKALTDEQEKLLIK